MGTEFYLTNNKKMHHLFATNLLQLIAWPYPTVCTRCTNILLNRLDFTALNFHLPCQYYIEIKKVGNENIIFGKNVIKRLKLHNLTQLFSII